MCHFRRHVLERQEVVRHLWRSSHLTGTLQTQHKKVEYQPVILDDERRKLQATDDAVRIGVIHVLITDTDKRYWQSS